MKSLVPEGTATKSSLLGHAISRFIPGVFLTNTGADQSDQVGLPVTMVMHFLSRIEGTDTHEGSSTDGLLVMNHEYVEPAYCM